MNDLFMPFLKSLRSNVSAIVGASVAVIILGSVTSCNRDKDDQQPIPVISSFSPTSGLPAKDAISGTTIRINGENFSTDISANELQFNGEMATIISATKNELVTTVPRAATTGKITLQINNKSCVSEDDFTVIQYPVMTAFAPASGEAGTLVTITGANFSPTPLLNTVKFGESVGTVTSASATQLIVTVPQGAATGKISVTVNDVTIISESNFIVPNSPMVTSFTPTSGTAGTSVTITGTNFSTTPTDNIVKFNTTVATVVSATAIQLVVTVPAGAATGKIAVTVNEQTTTSANDFMVVQPPTLTSFSPTSGAVGASVTITGTNFSTTPTDNIVKFNTTAATVVSAIATQLVVTVPAGAVTGKIAVTVNEQTTTSTNDFTVVQPPTLNSFSPTSGAVGASVTITGTNFSTTPTDNIVKFNTTVATVVSATATQLVVTVPAGAVTGKIAVTVNELATTSTNDFEVVLSPTITSFNNTDFIGAIIQITGTDFSTTPANNVVRFNGTLATVISATTTNLEVKVPVGTTQGRVTVTVGTITATSQSDFHVSPPIQFSLASPSAAAVGIPYYFEYYNNEWFPFLSAGHYNFKLNDIVVGTAYINPSPPNNGNPIPPTHLSVTLPTTASTARLLAERDNDKAIVGISNVDLEVLQPYPFTGLTSAYHFSNSFTIFRMPYNPAINLDHHYDYRPLPSFTTNRFGNANSAISFNGNRAATTTTDRISGKPWTISFWINYGALPQDVYNNGGISSVTNNVGVSIAMVQRNDEVGADLGLRVTVDDNDTPGNIAELTDYKNDPAYLPLAGTGSDWINLTLTYSGSLFRIYKNGIVVVEKTISGNKGGGTGPTFRVGEAGGYYYTGKMDDVLIYNTALGESDVMKIVEQTQTKY